MTEVHDCFLTELVTMEDLQLAGEGKGVIDVLDGAFDAEGVIPAKLMGAEMLWSSYRRFGFAHAL